MLRYALILCSNTDSRRRRHRRRCRHHRLLLLLFSNLHLHGLSALEQRPRPVSVRGRRHCLALDLTAAPTFHASGKTTPRMRSLRVIFPDLFLGAEEDDVVVLFQGSVVPEWRRVVVRVMSPLGDTIVGHWLILCDFRGWRKMYRRDAGIGTGVKRSKTDRPRQTATAMENNGN